MFKLIVGFLLAVGLCEAAEPKKVLISQVVQHPALDKTTQGIVEALAAAGYVVGENLILRMESAQGSAPLAAQIAAKFVSQSPDVVVAVGTLSAQSFAKYAMEGKVKLVFSSVTDPAGAGLVELATGVSNFVALEPQLELFKKLQPGLKRLGILYNPGELNSVSVVKKLEAIAPQLGLTLVKQTISKTADVPQSAAKLASLADAIFISNDNTALSSLQSVIKAAQAQKIPVYVSDTDAVELGAVAALGPNQYEVGQQTGRMVARLLAGEAFSQIPIEFADKTELFINLEAASELDLTVPDDLREKAARL